MFLGKYSMPIYLLHDPILHFFIFHVEIDQVLVSTLVTAAVVTLVLAILLTKLVEEPLRRFADKFIVNHKQIIMI